MFPRAVRVATIGGVDLRIDPSWILIIVVLVLSYRAAFVAPGRSPVVSVLLALAAALLFALSVLVHELAHALEGGHRGAEVAGITLFVLGGATALRGGDRRARDEFAIAAIGPWSNIVLAAIAGLVATGADRIGAGPVAEVAGVVGWLNIGLAVFNLVPGAPLDGGRVLRAGVWAVTGDKHRATVVAAWAGVLLSLGLFAVASWSVFGGPGGLWAALWTGAIAAYVLRASIVERRRGVLGRFLAGHRAGDLAPAAPIVAPGATVGSAIAIADEVGAVVVAPHDDAPGGTTPDAPGAGRREGGLVTVDTLLAADPTATVAGLARPLDGLPRVAVDAPGDELANLLDVERPYVVLTGADRFVALSSLRAIDRRVQRVMRGDAPDGAVA